MPTTVNVFYHFPMQEDGHVEGRVQRHRDVPDKLREAIGVFATHPEALRCVLVLGDFIDGRFDEVGE
jgi:hypothetical protein